MPYNSNYGVHREFNFTRLIYEYLTDDEYIGLQMSLVCYPDKGNVIPRTGGIRKLRWALKGKGKRSGLRVIYYWNRSGSEIWLLTLYGKSERATIPPHILKQIAEEIRDV